MAKLAKTRTASESRYKAAISDLQCQLAQREWTTIHSTEFAGVHSVASSMLQLLVKHGIIERRLHRDGKRNVSQYKRTARLSNLTASTFRNLNIAYQSQWYPSSLKAKQAQKPVEKPPFDPSVGVTAQQAWNDLMHERPQLVPSVPSIVYDALKLSEKTLADALDKMPPQKDVLSPSFRIAIMWDNDSKHRLHDAEGCKTVEDAIQYGEFLMVAGDERALVMEVKAVVTRKTVVTRY